MVVNSIVNVLSTVDVGTSIVVSVVMGMTIHLPICELSLSIDILRPFHTRPKKRIQCASNTHLSCSNLSGFGRCASGQSTSGGGLEPNRNRIRCLFTEFIVYSSNNDKITHGYTPMNSNIVEAFTSRPPYTLYSPSKIQTMMAYHAGTLLTRCCRKRDRLPSGLV